jgi:hypothetical protein
MKDIVIISKDRKGLVAEISEFLGSSEINIDFINARSKQGIAEIRLTTSDNDRSLSILNEAGFKAVSDENILVRVDDAPGRLGRISRTLSENNIDIRGIAMIEQNQGFNIVSIITDNDAKTRQILKDVLVE